MGLLLHNTSAQDANNSATIELIADLDLYEQYSRELNILHQVSFEPSTASLTELLQKIKTATQEHQGLVKP